MFTCGLVFSQGVITAKEHKKIINRCCVSVMGHGLTCHMGKLQQ